MNRSIFILVLAWTIAILASTSAADLTIQVQPVFEGQLRFGSSSPIRVEVGNSGPDARGRLSIEPSSDQVITPIDLPRGSVKTLLLYVSSTNSSPTVILSTNKGVVRSQPIASQYIESSYNILHISDATGELAFLRTERKKNRNSNSETSTYSPISVAPENVPDRVAGFRNMTGIVMGEGSERLSNSQVSALKQYVIGGGQITFVGGAASPILSDSRWFGALPIKNSTVQNRTSREIGKVFTNRIGELKPGSQLIKFESGIQSAFHSYGFGQISYLSINPLAEPFQNYEKRTAILGKILRPSRSNRVQQYLFDRSTVYKSDEYGSSGPRTAGPSLSSSGYSGPQSSNPFTLKLPETSTVAFTLIAYFVVVIPINFFILRKLKRLEWAWFSSPVISLAFAAILFQTASSLYTAKLSTNNVGVIVAQSGEPTANFLGYTQIFFPVAGYYDLKTSGIDYIDALSSADLPSSQTYYQSGNISADLKPIDTGEIQFPNAAARNLEFQQFSYRQSVRATAKISCLLKETRSGWRLELKNNSPYKLEETVFVFRGIGHKFDDIESGKSVFKELPSRKQVGKISENPIDKISANDASGILTARLIGFRPGPQIGTEIPNSTGIDLVMGAEWSK